MKEADQKRIEKLIAWAQHHGAELHPSLEVYHDDITKFSLRVRPSVTAELEPGFVAVTCPLSITLSYLNALVDGPLLLPPSSTQHTPAFPARFMTSSPPHVTGRFFLMQQYLKGADSFWSPYISTLPKPELVNSWALPAFWPEDDIAFLEGTNASVAIGEIQENVKREFKQARKVLKEESFPGWQDYSRLLYNWAFCIFTSRSFRPSLITSPSSSKGIKDILPPSCGIDDFSILQPLFDIANHSMTARYAWDLASNPNACGLICKDVYPAGGQIYNNYGMKSNSELLLGYGFILPETGDLHNDYVHVRKRQTDSETGKPKDFLISLRPINHPSSLAGRSRPAAPGPCQLHLLPQFSHFEPSLIYDLAWAVSSPEEQQALQEFAVSDGSQAPSVPAELQELIERIEYGLSAKLMQDYQRLQESEPTEEDGTEDEASPAQASNRNQKLALDYRTQCEKVLVTALQALGN
ncbi:hypothetical protein OQA88_8357 [Cercophora sp. LCS_1]